MKQYSAEADLLGRNRIETAGDLHDFTERISTEFETLPKARGKLRNRLRRMRDTEAMNPIRAEISELSERIRTLRREMVLCRDIAERSDAVEALLTGLKKWTSGQEPTVSSRKNKNRNRRKRMNTSGEAADRGKNGAGRDGVCRKTFRQRGCQLGALVYSIADSRRKQKVRSD